MNTRKELCCLNSQTRKCGARRVEDTLGLQQFYEGNAANYMWEERVDAVIYSCKSAKIAKKAQKLARKGKDASAIMAKCNAKDELDISTEKKLFEKGEDSLLSTVPQKVGVYTLGEENGRHKFVSIREVLPPSLKPLEDNLGQATSDYQNHLEAQWIEELKRKFPVTVFDKNVKKLYE